MEGVIETVSPCDLYLFIFSPGSVALLAEGAVLKHKTMLCHLLKAMNYSLVQELNNNTVREVEWPL